MCFEVSMFAVPLSVGQLMAEFDRPWGVCGSPCKQAPPSPLLPPTHGSAILRHCSTWLWTAEPDAAIVAIGR